LAIRAASRETQIGLDQDVLEVFERAGSSLRLVKRSVIPVVSAEEVRDSPSVSRRHQLRFGSARHGYDRRLHHGRGAGPALAPASRSASGAASPISISGAIGASGSGSGGASVAGAAGLLLDRLGLLVLEPEKPGKETAFFRLRLAHRPSCRPASPRSSRLRRKAAFASAMP
jgi:hypothetical protein